jgi:hypothetical protein
MKRVILNYPKKPKKTDAACCNVNRDPDPGMFKIALFTWKEGYKLMKLRMDKYKGNESNAWALLYDQCSSEQDNLKGMQDYNTAKIGNNVAKLLTMIHESYCCQFDLLSN